MNFMNSTSIKELDELGERKGNLFMVLKRKRRKIQPSQ